jgi:hypothetical protein
MWRIVRGCQQHLKVEEATTKERDRKVFVNKGKHNSLHNYYKYGVYDD